MPGPLLFYNRDPDFPNYNRGPGQYYLRSSNKVPHYSKYSEGYDKRIDSGPLSIGSGVYKHTHDFRKFKDAKHYPTKYSAYKKKHKSR